MGASYVVLGTKSLLSKEIGAIKRRSGGSGMVTVGERHIRIWPENEWTACGKLSSREGTD
jgi:hypothetical protein